MRLLPAPDPPRRRGASSWRGAAGRLAGPLDAAGDAGQAHASGHGHSGRREVTLTATGWPHAGLVLRTLDPRDVSEQVPPGL